MSCNSESSSDNSDGGNNRDNRNRDLTQVIEKDVIKFHPAIYEKLASILSLPETRKSDIKFNTRALSKYATTYELEKFDKNYLLIFNHVYVDGHSRPRTGTNQDVNELIETFAKWGFVPDVQIDLKKKDIFAKLKELASKDFTDYGCVVVAVLTHGGKNGLIYAKDTTYSELEIINHLHAHNNPTLLTKPRAVLIQACRGEKNLRGVTVGSPVEIEKDHVTGEVYTLPDESDMLVFHSSYIGKASHRPWDGSWFIQSLCSKINKMSSRVDLEAILTDVRREVAIDKWDEEWNANTRTFDINKQMPVSTSTLTRKLYLRKHGETLLNESETDHARPDTPPVQVGPCCCFLDHFVYIRECLRLFVAERSGDQYAKDILDIADDIEDCDSMRNLKEKTAKKICNYLRNNGKDEAFYNFLYYYTHKDE